MILWLFACTAPAPTDATEDSVVDASPTDSEVSDSDSADTGESTDLPNAEGFIDAFPLDWAVIERVSRFRSGFGHDFSDDFEDCRSMKHYFCMQGCLSNDNTPWTENAILSPVTGEITGIYEEQSWGSQVIFTPDGYPDFRVRVFHVTVEGGLEPGDAVTAGQAIGHHATSQTMSDIAVESYADGDYRLYSAFEFLSAPVRQELEDAGLPLDELEITAEERDLDPLSCDGEQFVDDGTLPHWVDWYTN